MAVFEIAVGNILALLNGIAVILNDSAPAEFIGAALLNIIDAII